MGTRTKHSLPYKRCVAARRCTAPAHFSVPNSRFCLDFYLPQGTPILATKSGIIAETESRYSKSYDHIFYIERCNYVVIEHNDKSESVYSHLAWRSVCVKKGDRVRKGQVIGLSGQTGYTSYPHLHYGLYDLDNENIRVTFDTPLPSKASWKRYS